MAQNNDLRNAIAQVVHDNMYALGNRGRSLIQLDFQTAYEVLHDERVADRAYIEGFLQALNTVRQYDPHAAERAMDMNFAYRDL